MRIDQNPGVGGINHSDKNPYDLDLRIEYQPENVGESDGVGNTNTTCARSMITFCTCETKITCWGC
jgi:hypothetical protein